MSVSRQTEYKQIREDLFYIFPDDIIEEIMDRLNKIEILEFSCDDCYDHILKNRYFTYEFDENNYQKTLYDEEEIYEGDEDINRFLTILYIYDNVDYSSQPSEIISKEREEYIKEYFEPGDGFLKSVYCHNNYGDCKCGLCKNPNYIPFIDERCFYCETIICPYCHSTCDWCGKSICDDCLNKNRGCAYSCLECDICDGFILKGNSEGEEGYKYSICTGNLTPAPSNHIPDSRTDMYAIRCRITINPEYKFLEASSPW